MSGENVRGRQKTSAENEFNFTGKIVSILIIRLFKLSIILLKTFILHLGTYPQIRLSPTLSRSEMYHFNFLQFSWNHCDSKWKSHLRQLKDSLVNIFAASALCRAQKFLKSEFLKKNDFIKVSWRLFLMRRSIAEYIFKTLHSLPLISLNQIFILSSFRSCKIYARCSSISRVCWYDIQIENVSLRYLNTEMKCVIDW